MTLRRITGYSSCLQLAEDRPFGVDTSHQGQLSRPRAVSVTDSRRPVHRLRHRAAQHRRPLCTGTRCEVVFGHTHRGSTPNAGPLAVRAASWKDDIDGPRPTTIVLSSSRHSSVNMPSSQQRRTGTGRNELLKNGATQRSSGGRCLRFCVGTTQTK